MYFGHACQCPLYALTLQLRYGASVHVFLLKAGFKTGTINFTSVACRMPQPLATCGLRPVTQHRNAPENLISLALIRG